MIDDPSFWVALGFVVFCAAIYKRLRHYIVTVLDRYILSVRDKIDNAAIIQSQAQLDLIACQQTQAQFIEQIKDINSRALLEVERLMQKSRDDMQIYLTNEEHAISNRLHNQELKILRDIEQQAIKIAIQACQNLLLKSMSTTTQEQLLQQTLQAIARANGKITLH